MAGIGFELRKIYRGKTVVSFIKGTSYATSVVVGPLLSMFICVLFLFSMSNLLNVDSEDWTFLAATIIYTVFFESTITQIIKLPISRWLADRVFVGETDKVAQSVFGVFTFASFLGLLVITPIEAMIFSEVGLVYALCELVLGVVICCFFTMDIFVNMLSEYKVLPKIYGVALVVFISAFALLKFAFNIEFLTSAIVSVVVFYSSMLLAVLCLVSKNTGVDMRDCFLFLSCFKEHKLLVLSSILTNLGMFMIIMACSFFSSSAIQVRCFKVGGFYDLPMLLSFLLCIPMVVMFVVHIETEFYDKYVEYVTAVNKGALKLIKFEEQSIRKTVFNNFLFLLKVPFLVCVVGMFLLNPTSDALIFAVGVFLMQCFNTFMLFLYYFSDYVSGFIAGGLFFLVSLVDSILVITNDASWQPYLTLATGAIGVCICGFLLWRRMQNLTEFIYGVDK